VDDLQSDQLVVVAVDCEAEEQAGVTLVHNLRNIAAKLFYWILDLTNHIIN